MATDNVGNYPRAAGGRFAPGVENKGRPKGSLNLVSRQILAEIRDLGAPAMNVLRAEIAKGNLSAAIFILERILPRTRSVELAGISPTDVAEAISQGEISPDEGRALAATIETLRRIEDIDALTARLSEIERLLAGKPSL